MALQLDPPYRAGAINAADPQRATGEFVAKGRVEPIAAEVTFEGLARAIGLGQPGTRQQVHPLQGFPQRAGQRADHRAWGVRGVFGVLGIGPAQHVARIFQQRVLKAAAGAEKGQGVAPRMADGE
ncbi:hypothetical protein D3C78_1302280 [compost metagenome]